MKLKTVKCQVCECRLEPFQESVLEHRNSCDMGQGCGLGRWNINILPKKVVNIKDRPPLLLIQKPAAVVEEKTKKVVYDNDEVEYIISDPLYIHIGKKHIVRQVDVK